MAVKLLEGQTVGIDLGTTYSSIAQLDDEGNPRLIMNVDDRDITPSAVLLGDTERVVVGPSFARSAEETPDRSGEAIKREMGNKDFHVVYQDRKLTPEFVSALIIKKLKQDAEQQIGPIANAVITVPYYFNDIRRKATQDAGRIAGSWCTTSGAEPSTSPSFVTRRPISRCLPPTETSCWAGWTGAGGWAITWPTNSRSGLTWIPAKTPPA